MTPYEEAVAVASGNGLQVWSNSIQVQTPFLGMPQEVKTQGPFKLDVARNEVATTQLVVSPYRKLDALKIVPADLKNSNGDTIKAEQWDIRRIGFINMAPPKSKMLDMRPDPLLDNTPTYEVAARVNVPYAMTLKTSNDTKPGLYKGNFKVTDGKNSLSIPVEVNVYKFALPDTARLKTFFYARHNEWGCFANLPVEETEDNIYAYLKEIRINGNQ